eukprot:gnl/Spiro4/22500_TR11101_c0_g3_i1.p1 gnl/Spiro4/22500_TR11101_c0_g3~~gnl/Spiro4/22500_TR11101_c0_g3_i1.p1  ORF type:complete len:788 (+),score=200.45 gnl/Spiro4/22500_TR11101_c0_g3_i1:32-2395(+)
MPRGRSWAFALLLLGVLHANCRSDKATKTTTPTVEQLEQAIRASYARVPPPFTVPPDALEDLIDTLVRERAELYATTDLEGDRKHVVMWLILLSGWASLNSLEVLTRQLAEKNLQICVDAKGASLGDVLFYLHSKGHFNRYFAHTVEAVDRPLETCTRPEYSLMNQLYYYVAHPNPSTNSEVGRCTLLADSMMLRRLRDVKAFREHVSSKKDSYRFVFPFGYEGVNVFDTRLVASDGKIDGWYHKLPDPATLSKAGDPLQLMVAEIERLTKAQLPDELSDVQVAFVSPGFPFLADEEAKKSFLSLDSSDLVKTYLFPNFRYSVPSLASWHKIFEMYSDDPETQLDIANTLSQYGLFYSPNMLGDLCANIHSALKACLHDTKLGVADLQFFITRSWKSYGLVTMLFFMQYPEISTANILVAMERPEPGRPVVVLDDLAGSGDSLAASARILSNIYITSDASPIFLAPLVQTDRARRAIEKSIQQMALQSVTVVSVAGSQLPADFSPPLRRWMGSKGYYGPYFISFFYMGPDNNAAFMSFVVAPMLALGGLGVKQDDPPPNFDRFKPLKEEAPTLSSSPPINLDAVLPRRSLYLPPDFVTFLCSKKGEEKFPVVVEFEVNKSAPPETTTLAEVSQSVGDTFNWVLTKNKKLVFGQLAKDNPLELGVSFMELAGAEADAEDGTSVEMYAAGQVLVNELWLEFRLNSYFSGVPTKQLEAVIWHLVKGTISQKEISLSVKQNFFNPQPTRKDFEKACDKNYKLKFADEEWNPERDGGPLPKGDVCKFEYECD